MRDEVADEAAAIQDLLAQLCVQLEAHDGDTARAILRDHASRLQASVDATRPTQRLLQLPAELISIVLRKLLEDRSTGALYALTSTCKFIADRGEDLQRIAGVGQRLLVAECAKLFPLIAREAASRDERYLLEYTNILLNFEEHRLYGGGPSDAARKARAHNATHTSFHDAPFLGETLVTREAQTAREVLAPLGFVVGTPERHDGKELLRLQCSIPGLPGTLHDGALHEVNLLFNIGHDYSDDRADLRNLCYPWRPPELYVPGQAYHYNMTMPAGVLGHKADSASKLLSLNKLAYKESKWNISVCVTEVLLHVQYLLHSRNQSHRAIGPNEPPAIQDVRTDIPLFRQRTREWALSTQAPSRLPEPPTELVSGALEDDSLEDPFDLELGGETWRVYRGDFLPCTVPGDVKDRRLVERDHLPY